jgi:hypothetical protein
LNWAGNTGAIPAKNLTDNECGFICPGNSSEYCGAGGKLSLFWFDKQKALSNGGIPS